MPEADVASGAASKIIARKEGEAMETELRRALIVQKRLLYDGSQSWGFCCQAAEQKASVVGRVACKSQGR